MSDKEKILAAVIMLKHLKRMVGFFMKKEISELIEKLEEKDEDVLKEKNPVINTV